MKGLILGMGLVAVAAVLVACTNEREFNKNEMNNTKFTTEHFNFHIIYNEI